MFKKPATLKPAAPLKNSDRRKLAESVSTSFRVPIELARELVPEGLMACKAFTHVEDPCTIFTHADDPLWVREGKGNDGLLFPTVYTLLRAPSLLPTLVTAPPVIAKLAGGADLMAPGLSERSLAELPELESRDLVSVSSASEPSVPRAVGRMAASKRSIRTDVKGKAVLTLHAFDDWLWQYGTQSEPEPLAMAPGNEGANPALEEETKADVGQGSEPNPPPPVQDPDPSKGTAEPHSSAKLDAAEVDAILCNALLLSIKKVLGKDSSLFPLPASALYSNYILSFRPAELKSTHADIKHSSYKKLGGLMKDVVKRGWISAKEVKGDWVVASVNPHHDDVEAVRPYRTVHDENNDRAATQADQAAFVPTISVIPLYQPSGPSRQFFHVRQALGSHREDLFTAQEVRALLLDYARERSLVKEGKESHFTLDDLLSDTLSQNRSDVATAAGSSISRQDGIHRLTAAMQEWHALDLGDERTLRKGAINPVRLTLKKKQGNKVVTVITGLETFRVSPQDLATELQIACAGGASANLLPQSTSKKPLYEVTVQGDQTKIVLKNLTERKGLPAHCVFIDHVQKSKK